MTAFHAACGLLPTHHVGLGLGLTPGAPEPITVGTPMGAGQESTDTASSSMASVISGQQPELGHEQPGWDRGAAWIWELCRGHPSMAEPGLQLCWRRVLSSCM